MNKLLGSSYTRVCVREREQERGNPTGADTCRVKLSLSGVQANRKKSAEQNQGVHEQTGPGRMGRREAERGNQSGRWCWRRISVVTQTGSDTHAHSMPDRSQRKERTMSWAREGAQEPKTPSNEIWSKTGKASKCASQGKGVLKIKD